MPFGVWGDPKNSQGPGSGASGRTFGRTKRSRLTQRGVSSLHPALPPAPPTDLQPIHSSTLASTHPPTSPPTCSLTIHAVCPSSNCPAHRPPTHSPSHHAPLRPPTQPTTHSPIDPPPLTQRINRTPRARIWATQFGNVVPVCMGVRVCCQLGQASPGSPKHTSSSLALVLPSR